MARNDIAKYTRLARKDVRSELKQHLMDKQPKGVKNRPTHYRPVLRFVPFSRLYMVARQEAADINGFVRRLDKQTAATLLGVSCLQLKEEGKTYKLIPWRATNNPKDKVIGFALEITKGGIVVEKVVGILALDGTGRAAREGTNRRVDEYRADITSNAVDAVDDTAVPPPSPDAAPISTYYGANGLPIVGKELPARGWPLALRSAK